MKNLILFIGFIALMVCFISVPIASADNGLHKGFEIGIGHTDHGQGKGLGHEKHGCDATCPLCGGNPCVPPCPGVRLAEPSLIQETVKCPCYNVEFITAFMEWGAGIDSCDLTNGLVGIYMFDSRYVKVHVDDMQCELGQFDGTVYNWSELTADEVDACQGVLYTATHETDYCQ